MGIMRGQEQEQGKKAHGGTKWKYFGEMAAMGTAHYGPEAAHTAATTTTAHLASRPEAGVPEPRANGNAETVQCKNSDLPSTAALMTLRAMGAAPAAAAAAAEEESVGARATAEEVAAAATPELAPTAPLK